MITQSSGRILVAALHPLLPVELAALEKATAPPSLFLTLSMRRSGQHLVIRWLCQNLGDAIHFNFCHFQRNGVRIVLAPKTGRRVVYRADAIDDSGVQTAADLYPSLPAGRFAHLLYSVEDHEPGDSRLRRLIRRHRARLRVIVVLRDACNWLASSMTLLDESAAETRRRVQRYTRYLRAARDGAWPFACPVTVILFDRFVLDRDYRRALAQALGIPVRPAAEASLREVPDFGGGSSFAGKRYSDDLTRDVFERWRHFVDNPHYRAIVNDRELAALDQALFPAFPSSHACRAAFGIGEERA